MKDITSAKCSTFLSFQNIKEVLCGPNEKSPQEDIPEPCIADYASLTRKPCGINFYWCR